MYDKTSAIPHTMYMGEKVSVAPHKHVQQNNQGTTYISDKSSEAASACVNF